MIIRVSNHADRIRLIAIETMKGAFGNEGALRFLINDVPLFASSCGLSSKRARFTNQRTIPMSSLGEPKTRFFRIGSVASDFRRGLRKQIDLLCFAIVG